MYVGIDTYFITALRDVLVVGRESHLDTVVALLDGYQCHSDHLTFLTGTFRKTFDMSGVTWASCANRAPAIRDPGNNIYPELFIMVRPTVVMPAAGPPVRLVW